MSRNKPNPEVNTPPASGTGDTSQPVPAQQESAVPIPPHEATQKTPPDQVGMPTGDDEPTPIGTPAPGGPSRPNTGVE